MKLVQDLKGGQRFSKGGKYPSPHLPPQMHSCQYYTLLALLLWFILYKDQQQ